MSTVEGRSTASPPLPWLSPVERRALADFAADLHSRYGSRIRRLVLFGSRARGEGDEESDLDVAVIFADVDAPLRREIYDLATEVRLMTEIPISPLVLSEEELAGLRGMGRGIAAALDSEGVVL